MPKQEVPCLKNPLRKKEGGGITVNSGAGDGGVSGERGTGSDAEAAKYQKYNIVTFSGSNLIIPVTNAQALNCHRHRHLYNQVHVTENNYQMRETELSHFGKLLKPLCGTFFTISIRFLISWKTNGINTQNIPILPFNDTSLSRLSAPWNAPMFVRCDEVVAA